MKKFIALVVIIIVVVIGLLVWRGQRASAPQSKLAASTNTSQSSDTAEFNKHKYSLSQADSLWVIVDKSRPLAPKTYTPKLVIPNIPLRPNITSDEEHVASVMAPALVQMVTAAKSQGINLNLQSGYRSYQFQVDLYDRYVKNEGQAKADTFSARPGYSEHQTGLAADLGGTSNPACNVDQCFASSVEGKWLATNAYRFGFILRYPKGQEAVTGYEYEPWHFRYVGQPLALQIHKLGTAATLEKFFGLPPAPNYQ